MAEKIRTVSVAHGDIKNKASCFEEYAEEFALRHIAAYMDKYEKPIGYEGMREYGKCLRRDLKSALTKDVEAWKNRKLPRGAIIAVIRSTYSFLNISTNPEDPMGSVVGAVYDYDYMRYLPLHRTKEIFKAVQGLTLSEMKASETKDLYTTAVDISEVVPLRSNPNEIPCENYIWDEEEKIKIPYCEDVVLMSHGKVDYNPNAQNPHIHNDYDGSDWDVDSWLLEICCGDQEMVDLIWQIAARIVRPYRQWLGLVLFSGTGNNGKGTLLELFRNLVGAGAYSKASMSSFGDRFGLDDLFGSQVVLCDENKMEFKFSGADRLKAATDRHSVFSIEEKNRQEKIYMSYSGLIIECVNELPRMADKTNAWYRKIIPIPFDQSYSGKERVYIKDDYLNRPEVLEYVKRRAIETEIVPITERYLPKRSYELLQYYKIINDPIRAFWNEMKDELAWDAVPSLMLHDLYVAWFKRSSPNGKATGRNTFLDSLEKIINEEPSGWETRFGRNQIVYKPNSLPEEPLLIEYDLTRWMNQTYVGMNRSQRLASPNVPDRFRGIVRTK